MPESLLRVVELWSAGPIYQCVQLAEYRGRMRLDRKMWLLMVNGAGVEKGGDYEGWDGAQAVHKLMF